MYDLINQTSIFNSLSNKIKQQYRSTYTEDKAKIAIKDAIRCAWNYAKYGEYEAKFNYNSSDDSESYNSDDNDGMYCSQRDTNYHDYMHEIRGNYKTMSEFLVFTNSLYGPTQTR